MSDLLTELKRRNVFKVGVLYLVTGWLLLQAGDVLFALLGLPDWTLKLVLGFLLLGFPVALVFSWIYELTPEGIKREKDVDRTQSITPETGQKINIAIGAGLAFAIGLLLYQQFGPQREVSSADPVATATPPPRPTPDVDTTRPALETEPSVAVLPFVNMSSDTEQEYFADGLSDTLMHMLSQVNGLKVAARTSSFAFKGQAINVEEIARELKVATLLEGSVQKAGDRVRVIAQLVDASDGAHLWSANFDRELKDIFAIQDEIAQEVVSALKVALLDEDQAQLAERYQPSLEAYEQVILGRQEVEKRTAEGLAAAEAHFKRAIELDPDYSLAHVGLADTYALQQGYADLILEESLELRAPLIERAIELDPLSGEAFTSRASWLQDSGDLGEAEDAFKRALLLNPSYARAHHWYSILLETLGRHEDRLQVAREAADLDPLSAIIQRNLADALWDLGRVEEAEFVTREGIRKHPAFPNNYGFMAGMRLSLGRIGEAKRWQDKYVQLNPNVFARGWGCELLIQLAADQEAEACIASLVADYPDHPGTARPQAIFRSSQGRIEESLVLATELRERYSGNDFRAQFFDFITAFQHAQLGNFDRARERMESAYPQFYAGVDPGVDDTNWGAAIWAAWIAQQQGDDALCEVLLQGAEKVIATRHRTRGLGFGVADVVILTMRGEKDTALEKLREAIDEGWRQGWRFTFQPDARLRPLADDPAFMTMAREVEADIAAQREWYFANRDTPIAQL